MSTKGILKRAALLGVLLARATYAQGNHWQDLRPTKEATNAGGDRLLAKLGEPQNYTLSILGKARFQRRFANGPRCYRSGLREPGVDGSAPRLPAVARGGTRQRCANRLFGRFKVYVIRAAVAYAVGRDHALSHDATGSM